jgi:hypothetical protein
MRLILPTERQTATATVQRGKLETSRFWTTTSDVFRSTTGRVNIRVILKRLLFIEMNLQFSTSLGFEVTTLASLCSFVSATQNYANVLADQSPASSSTSTPAALPDSSYRANSRPPIGRIYEPPVRILSLYYYYCFIFFIWR